MFTCLFASRGHDLRALLRNGASDAQLAAAVSGLWSRRKDRYSELRSASSAPDAPRQRIEMHYIGG